MHTKNTIKRLNDVAAAVRADADRLEEREFFLKKDAATWSVAEIILHLAFCNVPIGNVLKVPRLFIRRWGASERGSRDEATFLADYKKATAGRAWKTIPPFIPVADDSPELYLKFHAASDPDVSHDFYRLTGEGIREIPKNLVLNDRTGKADVLEFFSNQAVGLAEGISVLSEEDLDRFQVPLPYAGLITLREFLYFTIMHTRHHHNGIVARMAAIRAG